MRGKDRGKDVKVPIAAPENELEDLDSEDDATMSITMRLTMHTEEVPSEQLVVHGSDTIKSRVRKALNLGPASLITVRLGSEEVGVEETFEENFIEVCSVPPLSIVLLLIRSACLLLLHELCKCFF